MSGFPDLGAMAHRGALPPHSQLMAAGGYSFIIEAGATFEQRVRWRTSEGPVDITGYTFRMQIRETVDAETYLIELTTGNGRIVIEDAEDGVISLNITAADTGSFEVESAVYDIEAVAPGGTVRRLLQGSITISPEVTR